MTSTAITSLWVCLDCLMAHEDPCGLADSGHLPDREPLGLIDPGHSVTSGLLASDHAEDCLGEECDCEEVTFTYMPCEGCGSTLAGSRYALTLWEDQ